MSSQLDRLRLPIPRAGSHYVNAAFRGPLDTLPTDYDMAHHYELDDDDFLFSQPFSKRVRLDPEEEFNTWVYGAAPDRYEPLDATMDNDDLHFDGDSYVHVSGRRVYENSVRGTPFSHLFQSCCILSSGHYLLTDLSTLDRPFEDVEVMAALLHPGGYSTTRPRTRSIRPGVQQSIVPSLTRCTGCTAASTSGNHRRSLSLSSVRTHHLVWSVLC